MTRMQSFRNECNYSSEDANEACDTNEDSGDENFEINNLSAGQITETAVQMPTELDDELVDVDDSEKNTMESNICS